MASPQVNFLGRTTAFRCVSVHPTPSSCSQESPTSSSQCSQESPGPFKNLFDRDTDWPVCPLMQVDSEEYNICRLKSIRLIPPVSPGNPKWHPLQTQPVDGRNLATVRAVNPPAPPTFNIGASPGPGPSKIKMKSVQDGVIPILNVGGEGGHLNSCKIESVNRTL